MATVLNTGRYTITNVASGNFAVLWDADDQSDIVAGTKVKVHYGEEIFIANDESEFFAGTEVSLHANDSVSGRSRCSRRNQHWIIKGTGTRANSPPTDSKNQRMFEQPNMLADREIGTPKRGLTARIRKCLSDPICWRTARQSLFHSLEHSRERHNPRARNIGTPITFAQAPTDSTSVFPVLVTVLLRCPLRSAEGSVVVPLPAAQPTPAKLAPSRDRSMVGQTQASFGHTAGEASAASTNDASLTKRAQRAMGVTADGSAPKGVRRTWSMISMASDAPAAAATTPKKLPKKDSSARLVMECEEKMKTMGEFISAMAMADLQIRRRDLCEASARTSAQAQTIPGRARKEAARRPSKRKAESSRTRGDDKRCRIQRERSDKDSESDDDDGEIADSLKHVDSPLPPLQERCTPLEGRIQSPPRLADRLGREPEGTTPSPASKEYTQGGRVPACRPGVGRRMGWKLGRKWAFTTLPGRGALFGALRRRGALDGTCGGIRIGVADAGVTLSLRGSRGRGPLSKGADTSAISTPGSPTWGFSRLLHLRLHLLLWLLLRLLKGFPSRACGYSGWASGVDGETDAGRDSSIHWDDQECWEWACPESEACQRTDGGGRHPRLEAPRNFRGADPATVEKYLRDGNRSRVGSRTAESTGNCSAAPSLELEDAIRFLWINPGVRLCSNCQPD
ncbi:hypothetical protein C8R44DRAFT_751849 [Mycena epipterygia]|nr:hypothetical protein C8R44DRAFT_751849 [Mycena epipterygia]